MSQRLKTIAHHLQEATPSLTSLAEAGWRLDLGASNRIIDKDGAAVLQIGEGAPEGLLSALLSLPDGLLNLQIAQAVLDEEIKRLGPLSGQITEETLISGERFERFYRHDYPKGWHLEDLPYEASDENDVWVMAPDDEKPFRWFGFAVYSGFPTEDAGPNLAKLEKSAVRGRYFPLSDLYAAVYADMEIEKVSENRVDPSPI